MSNEKTVPLEEVVEMCIDSYKEGFETALITLMESKKHLDGTGFKQMFSRKVEELVIAKDIENRSTKSNIILPREGIVT